MNARQLGLEAGMEKAALSRAKKEWAADKRGVDPKMHKAIVLDRMTRSPKAKEHAAKAEKLKSEFSPFHQTLQRASWAKSKRGGSLLDRIMSKIGKFDPKLHPPVGGGTEEEWARIQKKPKDGWSKKKKTETMLHHGGFGGGRESDTRTFKGSIVQPGDKSKMKIKSQTVQKDHTQRVGTQDIISQQKIKTPPKPVPKDSGAKTHPVLSAIHMAKTHPDPAKRERMTKLVRDWHKAKSAKTALAMLSQHHLDARAGAAGERARTKPVRNSRSLIDKALATATTHPDPEKRKRVANLVLKYRKAGGE